MGSGGGGGIDSAHSTLTLTPTEKARYDRAQEPDPPLCDSGFLLAAAFCCVEESTERGALDE